MVYDTFLMRIHITRIEGMPRPENMETARAVEDLLREQDCIPATIALLRGRMHVGLSARELEELAERQDVMKVSRRDLAYAVAMQRYGSTTVSATMVVAHRVGVSVFVTGGIGDVHRGAEESKHNSICGFPCYAVTDHYIVLFYVTIFIIRIHSCSMNMMMCISHGHLSGFDGTGTNAGSGCLCWCKIHFGYWNNIGISRDPRRVSVPVRTFPRSLLPKVGIR